MSLKSAKEIWLTALGELQLQVTRPNYDTWLKGTVGVSYEDGLFVVGVPTAFAADWIEKRLNSLVRKTLIGILGRSVYVRFIVVQPHRDPCPSGLKELPLDRESADPFSSLDPLPQFSGSGPAARDSTPRLNPKYTFDTFVVGNSNRLPHAAALSVAESPGQSYNPLFIYGGVGLGKTHLLHAIGHVALSRHYQVIYVSSEQFTNEFINAIRERRNEDFRNKYRSAGLLLIDDIQFIADKEQTQEEFFHTFNDLHSANHQIILSSDRPPKALPLLEDRLRSRFEWGLIADIQPPDLETRLAILGTKAEEQGVAISPEVLDFIAHKVQSNIRELEGALNRIIASARLNNAVPTTEVANRVLEDLSAASGRRRSISAADVVAAVAEFYAVEAELILGKRRDKEVALARQVAMYLLREETPLSLADIGQQLGGRDHSTVLHGHMKISTDIQVNTQLRREVSQIRESLYPAKRP